MLLLFLKNTEAATGGAEAVTRDILLQAASLQVFLKETPMQVLSCEVSKTFKSTYFEEHLQMTASGGVLSCS